MAAKLVGSELIAKVAACSTAWGPGLYEERQPEIYLVLGPVTWVTWEVHNCPTLLAQVQVSGLL